MAFDTPGVQSVSTYRIAPTNNRLQKNMYGTGYSEFMDYSDVDALPNPGYGGATGMPVGGPGNQDVNFDLLMQRMTGVLQNQFGLKPKNQGQVYTSFPGMVPQGGFTEQGESPLRVHHVFRAR
jgi:hypothetical protein